MQELLLNAECYKEAVEKLSTAKLTSPCHFIVGGLQENEGIVISRGIDSTDHTYELSEDNWFVLQTNVDTWLVTDPRFEAAKTNMIKMG